MTTDLASKRDSNAESVSTACRHYGCVSSEVGIFPEYKIYMEIAMPVEITGLQNLLTYQIRPWFSWSYCMQNFGILCRQFFKFFVLIPFTSWFLLPAKPRLNKPCHYSILFYSILFYSILFYFILFYSILFCSVPFCSVLFCYILIPILILILLNRIMDVYRDHSTLIILSDRWISDFYWNKNLHV